MHEKTLLKISIITSLFGILIIFFINEKLDLSSNIGNITKDSLDEKVKIKGEIIKITETPGLYLLDVKDNTGTIVVIVFKEEILDLKQGNIVEIQGQVAIYKDKPEIIAKKITIL